MKQLPTKVPDEVWVCSTTLTPWIVGTNDVSSVDAELVTGSVTVDQVQLVDANTASFRLTGGTPLSFNHIRFYANMEDGQRFAEDYSVFVG
jgi:hypothetical protein